MYSNLQALDDPRVQEVIQEHILFLVVIYKKQRFYKWCGDCCRGVIECNLFEEIWTVKFNDILYKPLQLDGINKSNFKTSN